ncbi:TPA: hypothetical protein DCY67_01425 [Candidatus Acetothermia bacterium]|nr:hypothetical protein [Candidatus Acetothermia bacterium]
MTAGIFSSYHLPPVPTISCPRWLGCGLPAPARWIAGSPRSRSRILIPSWNSGGVRYPRALEGIALHCTSLLAADKRYSLSFVQTPRPRNGCTAGSISSDWSRAHEVKQR